MVDGNLFSKVRYGRSKNLGGEGDGVVYRLKLYNEKGHSGDSAVNASLALNLMLGDDWVQMVISNNIGFEGVITYIFEDSSGDPYLYLHIEPDRNETSQASEAVEISPAVREQILSSNFHGHAQFQGYPDLELKRR
ncbi:hypothetical protein EV183_004621 [Coemansia sp. RSA 2336]|nr:hypothetical protein EV183_004621 [Coemansia sp. RSA 2336]